MNLGRRPHIQALIDRAPSIESHTLAARKAPDKVDRSQIDFTPGLYDNDIYPNCTAVTTANHADAIAHLGGFGLRIDPRHVLTFFSQCTRLPDDPNVLIGCDGALLIDVMNQQGTKGFQIGSQELVGAWGSVIPDNRNMLALSISELGVGHWGVNLAEADQNMEVWDTQSPSSAGDPTPGSWGGHDLFGWDYTGLSDTDTVRLGTWGGWKRATWRWIQSRLDEAYVIAWRQLKPTTGNYWNGLDYDRLAAECASFNQYRNG